MLRIHALSHPALDAAAWVGWALGVLRLCAARVLALVAWHVARGERAEAAAWLAVGVLAALLPELLKALVARPRPALWPWLIPTSGWSFPSGHAAAGMALYPLLGWLGLRGRGRGRTGWALGVLVGAFVGLSRLYAGVHWPSDVAAGWALGLATSGAAIGWLARRGQGSALTAPAGSSKVERLGSR
jgi:undecaprenyl-diphosphatase